MSLPDEEAQKDFTNILGIVKKANSILFGKGQAIDEMWKLGMIAWIPPRAKALVNKRNEQLGITGKKVFISNGISVDLKKDLKDSYSKWKDDQSGYVIMGIFNKYITRIYYDNFPEDRKPENIKKMEDSLQGYTNSLSNNKPITIKEDSSVFDFLSLQTDIIDRFAKDEVIKGIDNKYLLIGSALIVLIIIIR